MANLKEIRGRIKSIKSIQKVTSAMKMVAAAKLRTSQSNMEQCRPYSNKISTLVNDLLLECDLLNNLSTLCLTTIKKYSTLPYFPSCVVSSSRGYAY